VIRALVWKEYREHRAIWLTMAGVTVLAIYAVTRLLGVPADLPTDASRGQYVAVAAGFSVFAYAIICGAMMLAGEKESRSLAFLDSLTARRTPLWLTKLAFGAVLILAQAWLAAGILVYLRISPGPSVPATPLEWFWILPALGLVALAWAVFFSSICRNVLTAAAASVLILPLSALLAVAIDLLFMFAVNQNVGEWLPFLVHGLLTVGAVILSWRLFCADDVARWNAAREAPWAPAWARGVLGRPRTGLGIRPLVWLTLRQGWLAALLLAVGGLTAGVVCALAPLTLASGALMWAVLTLLVGVVCGIGPFAGEQSHQSRKFLGDQRLPPGRVWAIKVSMWFLLAAFVACLILPGLAFSVSRSLEGKGWGDYIVRDGLWVAFPKAGLAVCLLYGFAIAQFCVLVFRQPVVAVVVAMLLGAGASVWWPSLVGGGLHAWQVVAPPAVLLVVSRLALWHWTAVALRSARAVLVLAGGAVASLAFTAGGLAYRVAEVPDVGQPFDEAAYIATFPRPEQNQAGELIRAGAADLKELWHRALTAYPVPKPTNVDNVEFVGRVCGSLLHAGAQVGERGIALTHPGIVPISLHASWLAVQGEPENQRLLRYTMDQLSSAHEHGWSGLDRALGLRLDFVFERFPESRLGELPRLPLGMIEDPRSMTQFWYRRPQDQNYVLAGSLLGARALQVQAQGDSAAGLDHLVECLALSRNLQHLAVDPLYHDGSAVEMQALHDLDRWLSEAGPEPALIRRALEELKRHDQLVARRDDNLKADYLATRHRIQEPESWLNDERFAPITFAFRAPWEQERLLRTLNAIAAGELRAAALDYPARLAAKRALDNEQSSGTQGSELLRLSQWLPGIETSAISPRRLAQLLDTSWLVVLKPFFRWWQVSETSQECWRRATELKLALTLYQMEQGRPARTLKELVPRYFTSVPTDPYSGQPFKYRLSRDERIAIVKFSEDFTNPHYRHVPAGDGILWSVGPDRVDDGGEREGNSFGDPRADAWKRLQLDLIFVVPAR
jgi:hypothetical protein